MRPCSKELRGLPFVAKRAIPVDMFPHTPHIELLVYFERKTEQDVDKSDDKQTLTNENEPVEEKENAVQSKVDNLIEVNVVL